MIASIEQIKTSVNRILSENNILSIATRGIRICNTKTYYSEDNLGIYCIVFDDLTIENLSKNPRLAFSINSLTAESRLQGNGIARVMTENSDGSTPELWKKVQKLIKLAGKEEYKIIKITPYRFSISTGEKDIYPETTIEKRKLEWVAADQVFTMSNAGKGGIANWIRFWSKASRSISFPLAIFPVAIGSILALIRGSFSFSLFILALFGGLFIHAGVNLISDYNDFRKGIDTTDALSSHTGILVNETVEPERILKAAFVSFMFATLLGGMLIGKVGWPVLLFGLAGVAGGYSYTGGPASYKYIGLGELIITLLMGPLMVLGAYYVQTQRLDLFPLIVSIPVGLLVGSVTLANNLRDILDDHKVGVITLPMRLGIKRAKIMYYLMTLVPYLIVIGIVLLKISLYPLLLVILSLPIAVKALKAMHSTENSAEDIRVKAHRLMYPLNSIKVHLQFNLFLLVGCLIIALLH